MDMSGGLPWELLTDSILLVIMSFLDAKSLMSAAKTCKHWYCVAHDNCLWKDLVRNKVLSKVPKQNRKDINGERVSVWKDEYVRMEDEAPFVLSENLERHTDEIYHISFSPSGSFFSTTGRDASVRIWKYGYPCTLHAERTDLESHMIYTRFSEFNQSETFLLVAGIATYIVGGDSCIFILSLKNDLNILYEVTGSNSNFRGCWLDDSTFLNGSFIMRPTGDRRFYIRKHKVKDHKKSELPRNLMDFRGQDIMILEPYCRINDFARVVYLPTSCLQQPATPSLEEPLTPQFEYIDAEKSEDGREATSTNCGEDEPSSSQCSTTGSSYIQENLSPVLIIANNTEEYRYPSTGSLRFYRVPDQATTEQDCKETEKSPERCQNFTSADADGPGGLVGMRLSSDNRYLAFNYRSCAKEEGEYQHGFYIKDIDLKVYDLYNMCFTGTVYTGHSAMSQDHLSYIFPAVSDHYLASGSEVEKGFLWDRRFGNILAELDHAAHPGNGGVNATVFHPHSEEVLISLGDDRKIKVWRSKRLLRELERSNTARGVCNPYKQSDLYRYRDSSLEMDEADGHLDDDLVTCCVMKKKSDRKCSKYT